MTTRPLSLRNQSRWKCNRTAQQRQNLNHRGSRPFSCGFYGLGGALVSKAMSSLTRMVPKASTASLRTIDAVLNNLGVTTVGEMLSR